ncbi:MAG: sigma 54-interacting transcriptional regulator [Pseudomonadota bacterium]
MRPLREEASVPFEPELTAPIATARLQSALSLRRVRITLLEGPGQGGPRVFDQQTIGLGTHPSNELRLTDETVSRFHARIHQDARGLSVRDLGSLNGSYLGAHRVEVGYLNDDDELRLGQTRLRVERLAEGFEVALSPNPRFGDLMGQSAAMRQLFAVLERIAPTEASVVLEGESGTGKDLAARGVHAQSRRCRKPFVVFDCGAAAPGLIESELFGHARGAFTGAASERPGVFEASHGGTVFIDEIGELPLDLQPKLLRVLEQREVRRLGENQVRPVDVRVIAATNRDLEKEVEAKRFREDLFYRLAVVRVHMPPLRERPDDIPVLIDHFLKDLATDGQIPVLSPEVRAALGRRPWLGNVRELRNAVARAVYLPEDALRSQSLAQTSVDEVDTEVPYKVAKDRLLDAFERRYLGALLASTDGNVSAAAKKSGINRTHLQAMLKKLGMRGNDDVTQP